MVFEALGETTGLFMSRKERGVDIVMPSEDIKRIGDTLIKQIEHFYSTDLPSGKSYKTSSGTTGSVVSTGLEEAYKQEMIDKIQHLGRLEDRIKRLEEILLIETYDGIEGAKWEKAKYDIKFKRIPPENDPRDEGIGTIGIDYHKRIYCTLGNNYRMTMYADYIDIYEDAIEMMKKIKKHLKDYNENPK